MRFLIDAQLPPQLARLFVAWGHEAIHVADVGLLTAADEEICEFAVGREMVVVTKDEDFATRHRMVSQVPRILWLRVGNTGNKALTMRLRDRRKEIIAALEGGEGLVEVR